MRKSINFILPNHRIIASLIFVFDLVLFSACLLYLSGFYPVVGWASTDKFSKTATSATVQNSVDPGISVPGSSSSRPSSLTKYSSTHSLGGASGPVFTSDVTFLLEGSHENTGTLIEWLRSEGKRTSTFSSLFLLCLFYVYWWNLKSQLSLFTLVLTYLVLATTNF